MKWGRPRKKRRRRRLGRAKRRIKAFVAGAGLGAAAGLLTPPKAAKEAEPSVEGAESDPAQGPPEK